MNLNTSRREFLKKALISGLGVAVAPQLLGKASPLVRMVGGQDVPAPFKHDGLVLGGHYFDEDAWIRKTEEIDAMALMKSGNDGWYGDQVVNPYLRPNNISEWEFVGSMAYHNGAPIQPGDIAEIEKSRHPFILDLNGDGKVDELDKQIFYEVLDGGREYSPSNWDWLQTVEERITMYEAQRENYSDTREGGTVNGQQFYCGEYALKEVLLNAGVENLENIDSSNSYSFNYINQLFNGKVMEKNGLLNKPVYVAHTKAKDDKGGTIPHAINATLIGSNNPLEDTPKNLDAFYLDEPQLAKRVYPGETSVEENSEIFLDRLCFHYNVNYQKEMFADMPFARFQPEGNGEYSLKWIHPNAVIERPDVSTGMILPSDYGSGFEVDKIYPNLISKGESINMEYNLSGIHSGKNTEVQILDITGREIYRSPLESNYLGKNKVQINTSRMDLSSGQYLVRLLGEGKATKAKRMIVR